MEKTICMLLVVVFTSLISCHQANVDLTVQDIEIFQDTPAWDLAIALDNSNYDKAKEILSIGDHKILNYQDPLFGTTLLMRAISKENHETARFLLANGANPDVISKTGTTALFRATSHSWHDTNAEGNPLLMKLLLEHGANPNISYCAPQNDSTISPIECGTSPLMHAVQRGIEKVKILAEYEAEIDYKTELGKTAAIVALMMNEVEVAHYLIVEKKARINEPYFFHDLMQNTKINYEKPHMPISLLEDWLYPENWEEYLRKY